MLEAQVAVDRKAAAQPETGRELEARAAAEEASVALLLGEQQAAQRAAARNVAEDKRRHAELERGAASVERRFAVRIAKAKAEAAARRAAAKRAAEREAAKARRAKQSKNAAESTKRTALGHGRVSGLGFKHLVRRARVLLAGGGSDHLALRIAASTRSCATGSCTTVPTSAPAAGPRSAPRTPAASRSATTTAATATG